MKKYPERPFRYFAETRPISFWESVRRLWITWKWNREEIYMRPVKKGEPGYDEAPFEETIIWYRNTYSCKTHSENDPECSAKP
jgi:hypothetical protein